MRECWGRDGYWLGWKFAHSHRHRHCRQTAYKQCLMSMCLLQQTTFWPRNLSEWRWKVSVVAVFQALALAGFGISHHLSWQGEVDGWISLDVTVWWLCVLVWNVEEGLLERNDTGGEEVFFVCGKYICLGEASFLRRTSSCVVSFLDVRTNVELRTQWLANMPPCVYQQL